MESLERSLRRWIALVWIAPTLMAVHGAWRGRLAAGRKVGRPFAETPRWLFAAILPPYLWLFLRLWRPLPLRLSPAARLLASIGGAALSLLGIALVVWGRVALGRMYNVSSALGAQLYERHELVTAGPFGLVRHPMYAGALVAGLGSILLYRTWTMVVILPHGAVFVARARKEEQALADEFGPAWDTYCERVPGWIPRLPRQPITPRTEFSSSSPRPNVDFDEAPKDRPIEAAIGGLKVSPVHGRPGAGAPGTRRAAR